MGVFRSYSTCLRVHKSTLLFLPEELEYFCGSLAPGCWALLRPPQGLCENTAKVIGVLDEKKELLAGMWLDEGFLDMLY
jgi:hypothetical protein